MNDTPIQLLVRADDIGMCHAANEATIRVFTDGICRSCELMIVTPWFPEAVEMLKAHPDYDVGIHLALTSEWDRMKWRPITGRSSLCDKDGYFMPTFWSREDGRTLANVDWKIEDAEKEIEAQVEVALDNLGDQVTHIAGMHMGGTSFDERIGACVEKIARETNRHVDLDAAGFGYFRGFQGEDGSGVDPGEMVARFRENLEALEPGRYLHVEHPGLDCDEMRPLGHNGDGLVARQRQAVTDAWTDPGVQRIIADRGIRLVSYGDVARGIQDQ